MASSQSILEIIIQAVDESAAALEGAQTNLRQVGQEAIATGTQLTIIGAAITGAYVGIVDSAANVQESQDSLKQAVTDAMKGASTSSAAFSTQVEFLRAKIDGYKASMASAQATLDTHTGSVEKSAAAHAKAAATIQADQVNVAKYQAQLDQLLNVQKLSGGSIDDITSKLEAQATANVNLGFSISDSNHSLSQAFTATKSVSEAMQVNAAAMDLARAKNIDLGTATNQVILAMNGQGRALAAYGIQIKDGLSGMDALQAVQGAVNGQAQAYAQTLTGQLSIAMQTTNKLFSDMGNTQLPVLQKLLSSLTTLINAVESWTQHHQKLTEYILLAIGILGVFITVLGTLLIIVGTIILAVALLGGVFIAIIAALVVLAAAVILNWNLIKQTISNALKDISNFVHATLADINSVWNFVWGGVSTFFMGIWDGMKTAIVDAINFIKGIITQFVSWATGIFAPITNTIGAIANVASGIMGAAKGAVGAVGSVLHVNDAIITPSGQVIQTSPQDYLFATKNPSSIGGGGGVTVNLNGGMYLSENSARMIADQVAKLIGRQMKIRNYAS